MARIWKPQDNETLRCWIDAILVEASDKLNEWEMKFVEDMDKKVARNDILTEAQEKKLESIYADKTS